MEGESCTTECIQPVCLSHKFAEVGGFRFVYIPRTMSFWGGFCVFRGESLKEGDSTLNLIVGSIKSHSYVTYKLGLVLCNPQGHW